MDLDEVDANVHWFAIERVGPRTPACTVVVLSGVSEPAALAARLPRWRDWGVETIVWHLGEGTYLPELGDQVDTVARVIRTVEAAKRTESLGRRMNLVVPLSAAVAPLLGEVVGALERLSPTQVVLQWPFPGDGAPPPSAVSLAGAVRGAVTRLERAGHAVGVKGLPPCALSLGSRVGPWVQRAWRTRNRWYVDSDHQTDGALVFFPDLARYAKPDSCRFCAVARRCDGVLEPWLAMGLAGPLTPLHTS